MEWYRNLWIMFSTEDKLPFLEQPIHVLLVPPKGQANPSDVVTTHQAWVKAQKEIVGLMLMTMDPDIQKNLEHLGAYDMLKELKRCHAMTQNLSVNLILVSPRKEYDSFVQNYNMHSMGKTENQKKKSHKAAKENQGKGKAKMDNSLVSAPFYAPKPKNPLTPKKDNPAKDAICNQCGEVEGDENATNPPPVPPTPQAPHTLSTNKLPILKKDEYDIWAMKIEHYLGHTDYPIWEVIQKENSHEAIKSRFGGNDESKKMQKYILKQQFESFPVSNSEGLHKGYDRFQSLLSQLEIHGAGVSTEDANQKFLSGPQLDHEDLEQVDEFYLEEMDLKWQVAMISTRLKKFYKKTRRKLQFDANEPVGFDKTKVECFNYHNTGYFARECISKGNQESKRRDAGNTRYKARDNGKRPAKQDEHKDMMSAKDKFELGYGNQIHDGVLSYENKVLESMFDSRSSDVEDSHVNDIFAKVEGMHAVPPLMTENYMPPKQSKNSESNAKTSDLDSCESKSSVETLEYVPKPVESKPKAISKPKVWSDAPIIKEYESDSDDEYVFKASMEQEKPSCAFINTVKHVKTPRQTTKDQDTSSTSTVRKVTTARPIVNEIRPRHNVYKSHSPIRRPFYRTASPKANFANHKVTTAEDKTVSVVGGNKETAVKASADYQDFNGGLVSFEGSKGQITGEGIKREYSNARTAQQNRVVERMNRTLIEVARTMLADSFLPNTFWAKAVSTACYVLNRVLVTKPQNKTHYELLTGKVPIISYIRPFGCHVTILNTINHLGKFKEKSDEGFLVGYSLSSKDFKPITAENKANKTVGLKEANNSAKAKTENDKLNEDTGSKTHKEPVDQEDQAFLEELKRLKRQEKRLIMQLKLLERCLLKILRICFFKKELLEPTILTIPIPQSRIPSIHSTTQILRDPTSAVQTRSKVNKSLRAHAFIKPKKISQALEDESWVDVMQEELMQFKTQQIWILGDLPFGKKVIGTKWVYKNKKDERGVVARNKTSGYIRELIDKILFIKNDKKDIMLKEDGIFISQDKYVAEILKKFDFMSVKTASTPIETKNPLVNDEKAADVDVHLYRSMIASLMYLTASRPDIMYAVCACSRFQVTPNTSHLYAVKRIFRYLKGHPKLGLWYPTKIVTMLEKILTENPQQENAQPVATLVEGRLIETEKRVNIKESFIRRTPRLDDAEGISCLTNNEIFEGLARMRYEKPSDKLTFYKAFFSPQWKFLIHTILQCLSAKTTSWNEFSSTMASAIICLATNQKFNFLRYILLSLVKNIEVGVPFFMFPRFVQLIINHQLGDMTHHKEIFDTPSLTKKVFANIKRVETGFSGEVTLLFAKEVAKHTLPSPSHDPLPSGKDSMKLKELMELCTNLSNKVLDLESEVNDIKSTYQARVEKLESRVERLEEENMVLKELKSVHSTVDSNEPIMEKEQSSKQGRKIADTNADVEINLEKAQAQAYNLDLDHQEKVLSMLDVNDEEPADVEEVLEVVKAAKLITEVVTTTEATKVSVPRKRRVVIIQDPKKTTTTAIVQLTVQTKYKGKAILIKEPKPLKKQAQIKLDEEVARKLEAELNADINWNVMIEQVKRSERLTDAMDYFKGMSYNEIRPLFEKHYNYNQAFLDEMNEGVKVLKKEVRKEKEVEVKSSKREDKSLEEKITKKQKMEQETKELKKHLLIFPDDDDDVYTDATPLASKIPIIVSQLLDLFFFISKHLTQYCTKEAWDIIADDVTSAVLEFINGRLLELNHTIIALILKVKYPARVSDYLPISCCNVLFKSISKIIANRIKESLKVLVNPNQSAFVPRRSISDNILLAQELMHNYHLDHECVSTASYSISINGDLHGYFKGKRGLRQGDSLSPYLFTLVMDVLTLMHHRRVRNAEFTYHRYCLRLNFINLCFADDLFLFTHGDAQSTCVIKEVLEEFKHASGLVPSISKSTAYFCNVLNHVKRSILDILPFEEGRLPVKYLGVPLISSRLIFRDCKELIEKVEAHIQDWKNKSLSFAGRLQLIRSVVGSMHIYWAFVFIIRKRVLLDLEQIMRSTRFDAIEWRDETGVVKPFSVSMVWEAIRYRNVKVPWFDIVWFSSYLLPFANRRSSRSIISKLVVAACAYFIWQERNSRLFKKKKRLVKQVVDCIYVSVRLKLLSCRFKRTIESLMFARLWQLPNSIFK
uniref:Reverse transcriptase domain-containing protein n=1 Tax=Tanacetum cinerariifolium TaxID=118510 RepID=A0A6L2JC57_TANCI|nr:hypothetical protein [Tanacetum cinerariifolium]